MRLKENHLAHAVTAAGDAPDLRPQTSRDASRNGFRSWVLTIAISTAVVATMYGLAYWNEAHGDVRAISASSQNMETPHR